MWNKSENIIIRNNSLDGFWGDGLCGLPMSSLNCSFLWDSFITWPAGMQVHAAPGGGVTAQEQKNLWEQKSFKSWLQSCPSHLGIPVRKHKKNKAEGEELKREGRQEEGNEGVSATSMDTTQPLMFCKSSQKTIKWMQNPIFMIVGIKENVCISVTSKIMILVFLPCNHSFLLLGLTLLGSMEEDRSGAWQGKIWNQIASGGNWETFDLPCKNHKTWEVLLWPYTWNLHISCHFSFFQI